MSDEELHFIADRDDFIGVTMFPPFLRRGLHANVMDCVKAIDDTINLAVKIAGASAPISLRARTTIVLERSAFVLAQSQAQARLCYRSERHGHVVMRHRAQPLGLRTAYLKSSKLWSENGHAPVKPVRDAVLYAGRF